MPREVDSAFPSLAIGADVRPWFLPHQLLLIRWPVGFGLPGVVSINPLFGLLPTLLASFVDVPS